MRIELDGKKGPPSPKWTPKPSDKIFDEYLETESSDDYEITYINGDLMSSDDEDEEKPLRIPTEEEMIKMLLMDDHAPAQVHESVLELHFDNHPQKQKIQDWCEDRQDQLTRQSVLTNAMDEVPPHEREKHDEDYFRKTRERLERFLEQ